MSFEMSVNGEDLSDWPFAPSYTRTPLHPAALASVPYGVVWTGLLY